MIYFSSNHRNAIIDTKLEKTCCKNGLPKFNLVAILKEVFKKSLKFFISSTTVEFEYQIGD